MGDWMIKEWDGNDVKAQYELPGHMSEQEIETALQRLVCRDLSVNEILAASRRRNDPMRIGLLDRVGQGRLIDYGRSNLHYTAERKRD